MYESLALLLVALRGVAFQAVGYVVEVWLVVALVGQPAFQLVLAILLEGEVVLPVGVEQVGVHLVAHHLVGYHELCLAANCPVNRDHAEVEQQTEEIVGVVDALGWEVLVECAGDEALGHQLLDDACVVEEVLVVAYQHAYLVVVDAYVGLHHAVGHVVAVVDVVA